VKLLHVVGARPNFLKMAPVYRAGASAGLHQVVVHTGQHYDDALSADIFRELGIAPPDINLAVGSGSHAVQTARVMERIEPVLRAEHPDWTIVYGDVNSTMAAAIVAAKLELRVAHVEAGLRSFDRTMPEEINRIVTDRLADLLLTPSREADAQLMREGESASKIGFVGNVMIDSLFHALPAARAASIRGAMGIKERVVLVTLHRPSNVDDPARLRALIEALDKIAIRRPVVFPAHPRTKAQLEQAGIRAARVRVLDPISYLAMLDLIQNAYVVITDSGGLQEETTALGVPCFTVRPNTERPITITEGTNRLVDSPAALPSLVAELVPMSAIKKRPEGWDGRAGPRVIAAISER
jgi:UDP-N-acetylglucosamine 2-epimerase (non-hydrolysing)